MFPFNLSGPAFLLFYAATFFVLLMLLALWRRVWEGGVVPALDLSDPYPIACLRDGADEVLRIATLSLVEREGRLLSAAPDAAYTSVPVEQALMTHFREPGPTDAVLGGLALRNACQVYADALEKLRLLPDAASKLAWKRVAVAAAAFIWLLGAAKLSMIESTDHENVRILFYLSYFFGAVTYHSLDSYRTWLGDQALDHLRRLVAGRAQAASGSLDASTVLLASVLGIAALPPALAEVKELFRSAGTGSSGGVDGGGGGGGGDDGGGCGGCGGCAD